MIESDASWKLFDTIKSIASSNGQSTNAMATCVRVLSDGTRMMQLVGSSILTPLNGNMAAEISQGDMAEVRIEDGVMSLTANVSNPSVGQSEVDDAVADKATVRQLGESNARIEHLEVTALTAESATIANLQADTAKVHDLTAEEISAATAYVGALDAGNVTAAQLIADHATVGALDSTYAKVDMANVNNAWISSGTIKNGAIVSAMINDVSANKLTAGTINGSVINVTNLNADNITAGTINGQRIGQGSLSLDKLSEDVYTESEVDSKLATMQAEIDGAIETWTGTVVPTLNNSPASGWTTNAVRDTHVGDVYFVVNSQSQQNGYNYRFTKSGSTYSWQLIKDNDVTNALQRLETAEGKITSIESFDSTVSSFMTNTDDELTSIKSRATSLETRMTDAEGDISDKVDTSTFNTLSQTVDTNTASITSLSSTVSQKADGSTVTALTNRVSTVEQDVDGIETSIGELQTTVSEKADSSTVTTISNKLNTVSDTVDGHTQSITSLQNTVSQKADGSTVSTLSSKVNTIEDTVDGHTSQLTSITSTQTTMQSTLDKTVKSSIQLWYSKANTTAPGKPTSQVTSTSTSGGAWRIVVPAYNASYPNYYYCWQYEYTDGTYGWSAVVRDIAMGESQATARTADSNASAAVTTANTANTNASTALTTANTANTNASEAKTTATTASTTASEAKTTAETAASDASTAKTNAASAVSTANSASTTATNAQSTANANIKSSVQLWFTKANSTAPNKPTSVVSTSNANTANAWNLVVPVWNKNYPHYYYCYQQQKGDGTYQWTDVVYDRATSEAQQLANTTSTNLSTLQTDYATFKQTTEQFESTVGTTYATKTELKGATDDITELESRVSTNETSISNNSSAIALKANSSDVYTKTDVDGKITQEVSDRNAAITAKANEITSSVSETYATKTAVNGKADASDVTALAGRVTTAESNITQNAQNIELKVSKDGVISSINQSAESVTIDASKINLVGAVTIGDLASATQDAVLNSNLQVGGRNLLTGTVDWSGAYPSSGSGSASGDTFTFSAHTSLSWYSVSLSHPHMPFSDVDGQTLTLSFDYRSDDFSDTSGDYRIWINAAASATESGSRTKYREISTSTFDGVFVPTTEWQRGSITFDLSESLLTAGSGECNYFYIQFYNHTLNSLQLRHVKLERGNKATDWSPAPEDQTAYADESAYQSARPNLAPLGTVDFSDKYNAADNPSGYWRGTIGAWYTRLDDGWVRVYADNTSGTSAINSTSWRPSPSPSVVAGSVYTILTEIRNNHSSGSSQTDMYLQQIANNQFWGDINGTTIDDEHVTTTTNISLRTCGETYSQYSYRIADTEHLTTVPIEMFRYNFRLPAGGKFDFEFRQSVYEGIYEGPYKPYAGTQLFATQTDAADAAKTATNYIVADSSGIKIADANPASSTTYQHQSSSGTDFVVNGGVRNRVNADGMTLYDGNGVADSNIFAKFASQLIELGRNSINSIIKLCNGVGKISVETGTTTTMRIEAESTSEINAHTYISKSALDLAQAYGAAIGGFKFKDSISTANRLSYATVTARDTGQVEIDTQRDDGSTQHLQFDDSGLAINRTKGIRGINFGYAASITNQNGIVTFNPGMGVKPTAVFVTHALASNETNDVAKIAVPFVWAIDSATQVQVRWKRTDSNDYLKNNAVGYYWLAIY